MEEAHLNQFEALDDNEDDSAPMKEVPDEQHDKNEEPVLHVDSTILSDSQPWVDVQSTKVRRLAPSWKLSRQDMGAETVRNKSIEEKEAVPIPKKSGSLYDIVYTKAVTASLFSYSLFSGGYSSIKEANQNITRYDAVCRYCVNSSPRSSEFYNKRS